MRTREAIEEDYRERILGAETLEQLKGVDRMTTLELLLDIRDLLQENQEEIKTIRRRI